jgi:hypothetical protein
LRFTGLDPAHLIRRRMGSFCDPQKKCLAIDNRWCVNLG